MLMATKIGVSCLVTDGPSCLIHDAQCWSMMTRNGWYEFLTSITIAVLGPSTTGLFTAAVTGRDSVVWPTRKQLFSVAESLSGSRVSRLRTSRAVEHSSPHPAGPGSGSFNVSGTPVEPDVTSKVVALGKLDMTGSLKQSHQSNSISD